MSCSQAFLERMPDKNNIPEHTMYTDGHTHYNIA